MDHVIFYLIFCVTLNYQRHIEHMQKKKIVLLFELFKNKKINCYM